MTIINSLKERRSYYRLNKELTVLPDVIQKLIEEITELVPDAFDMKSARIIVVFGKKHDELWDKIYNVFGGKVAKDKIEEFKAAAGTILYFYDNLRIYDMQKKYPLYANNFQVWANQANGMLQISVWSALRELKIGANLQHYNPVINDAVKQMFNVPDSWKLVAQMPFGGIVEEPDKKAKEDISERVIFVQN